MKTNIAILGVGRWGVHWLRNFLHHPQTEVVAIVDPLPERLTECRNKFSLSSKIILAREWNLIRQLESLDAVVVATPAVTHYSLIADALQLGYHVLAEKPLTLAPQECIELGNLAQQQKRQLFIDHTYLFHPAVEKGQQLLQWKQLGDLYYGYASRTHLGPVRQDVDALWDLAIHDIAIFNYWLGQTPIQVQATGKIWLQPALTLNIPINQTSSPGLADLVWITLTYPTGFQAYIHLSWLNPDKQRRLSVVGNQGSLIFDEMLTNTLTLQRGYLEHQEGRFIPVGLSQEVIEVPPAEPLRQVCDHFIEAIHSQKTPVIASTETATNLVKILTGLTLSLLQQGTIIDLEKL
jgi:predicted dehydrogenase